MKLAKHLFISVLLLQGLVICAQDAKIPVPPRFTLRINCGIPKITSSQLLRNSFSGVVMADGNLNVKLFSNFFVGGGYSYSYFKAQRALSDVGIFTNMQLQNGYLKIGFDKFISENQFLTFSVNTGYNYTFFQGIKYPHDSLVGRVPTNFTSTFVEPQIGFYFLNDDNIAIGAQIGYYYNFSKFDIRQPVLDKWLTNSSKLKNNWDISAINISIGIYYGIGK